MARTKRTLSTRKNSAEMSKTIKKDKGKIMKAKAYRKEANTELVNNLKESCF